MMGKLLEMRSGKFYQVVRREMRGGEGLKQKEMSGEDWRTNVG